MVVLNDWGLTLEIIGFAIFLFVPLQETYNIVTSHGSKLNEYINKHDKLRQGLRFTGIIFIIIGLIMQYSFFQ